ncbi:pol ii transcription elongation factor [Lichtheimia corymbifera JMRC:FSU:9682]|uniref:Elongator complex protein 1 n=1 Tax=Lichtheimia corymbifera JMRC:FSU:9682 TaxID=1263082 RepID=A0A068SE34_9FUNG|nr:pol ii transcription elongation factor [Lichtheimia corymbifera JMRC:FSU:9682]
MRSLQLLAQTSARIAGINPRSRAFIANNPEDNTTFVAFEDSTSSNIRVLLNGIAPDDALAFVELARVPIVDQQFKGKAIVGFTYLADQQVACLAARNGDIMLFSKERFDNGEEALEIVGSVDTGIEAMAWSPDQDLVVLVTGHRNVLEMTQDFDTITEFPLHVEEQGEGVQHSVGWGRKETQFHGSAGKQAALNKVDTSKFTLSEDDDHNARIAWRGDGSFFVVSDIDQQKSARVARIYNREGILQNTSEPVDRLEHVLDWRPSGNLIVSSQRLPHRHDIVFLERNGLRHGEFTLREKTNHKLLEVSWNADSTMLAVWLEAENAAGKRQKTVQLWTANNYYWYMKQHLVFANDEDIVGFQWDVESPLCAHIATSGCQYHKYNYATNVIASTSVEEDNAGYVAVIDGEFKISDNEPSAHDETYRRVERGARIVLATQLKPNLVLQMPRGNLETVSPRAFVLARIREDVKALDYRPAFIACRRNRIDLNILYDEDPELFFENIPKFIEQVPEVDHLNLFLSNLKNEDTTKTLYQRLGKSDDSSSEVSGKVNKICKAFRDVLMDLGRDQYIQSILSTYVKSTPPDLESALQLLADIKQTSVSKAEEALAYTIFLCDADSLYNVALGMYNFSLVLMVAQQAQKDPREYLPFLQELQKLEKFYQRFRIDDYLKRYASALRNLTRAGDEHFDELLNYMRKHTLYKVALEEYANNPEKKNVILNAYAEHLADTSAYDESAIVYQLCNEMEKALNSYRLAGSWREAFAMANQLQHSEDDIQGLAYDLMEYLKDKSRFDEAAIVAVDYAKDVEEAVDCLLRGSHWQEAIRVSHTQNRSDLIETHVKPGLFDGYSQMDEDLNDMSSQFHKQKDRLKELREKKPEPTAVLPHDESLDNIDMFSDTTSMFSQFTRYTSASSRMSTLSSVSSKASRKSSRVRRREQRKKERGKKGTIYEEEYLVKSIKKLCEKATTMQNDVRSLLSVLVPFGYMDEARNIQEKFAQILVEFKEAIPTVFVPLQLPLGKYATQEEIDAAKEPVSIEKPTMQDIDWKLQILS